MKFLFYIIFVILSQSALANDSIVIKKDPRIDVLAAKQAQINRRTAMMTSGGQFKGFRIQVVSTTSRDNANKVKADLLNRFPDQKSYLLFQAPNFKVRIGNFLKKEEAEIYRKKLNRYFPQGLYIVEDAIEYTVKEEEL